MKISFPFGRILFSTTTALALTVASAQGQQPLGGVTLAEPVASQADEKKEDSPAVPATPAQESADAVIQPKPLPEGETGKAETAPEVSSGKASPEAESGDAVIELVKERHSSGEIKIEREMTQDASGNYLMHGAWRFFDNQGRLIVDGQYSHNQKEGLWRKFYLSSDAALLDTAPYKEFAEPFISSAAFHANVMHGKWTLTDAKQRKVHEIEFCDGERHGKAVWYYPNGAIMLQARYEHGRVNGDVLQFAADGSVIAKESYQSGRKLAPKTEFFDQAKQVKKQEITFLHAMLVVKTPDNWDTATLATFESRGEDERHGPYTIWHSNGQLARQGEFRYNLPVGKLTIWFENGQKKSEGTYADGRQEGVWIWWHDNGQKAITGEYHDGNAVGRWSWWTAGGKLAQKTDLSHDRTNIVATPEVISERREARAPASLPGLPRR